jgi:hypothetical protein
MFMSEIDDPQRSTKGTSADPKATALRLTGLYLLLAGLGFLVVGAALIWLVGAVDWLAGVRLPWAVVVLIPVGAMLLWVGLGALIYPSPEAMRREPLEGSMVKTFQAMPLFWQIWYGLMAVIAAGTLVGTLIWLWA